MGQGLTNQIVNSTPGMRVVAISNRKVERAVGVYNMRASRMSSSPILRTALDDAIRAHKPVATEDAMLLARSEHIDVSGRCRPVRSSLVRMSCSRRSSTARTSC